MGRRKTSHFDQAAATWDDNPSRIALMKAVGEAILRQVQPTAEMDVLDYGCGTGLVGLFLLPHVGSVTGADNSAGMLDMLRKKIEGGGLGNMRAVRLDLEHDPVPTDRYDLIVSSMALHHIADMDRILGAFHELLHPQGFLCLADLDTEPGTFHTSDVAPSVHHHGFDRAGLKARLSEIGFHDAKDVTAHTLRKPVENGGEREFPVFLITARRPNARLSDRS
jgi:ubiquinone/menaquinone biosynthesis C-methylase UbiE